MTNDEKRQQRAMLLLEYEETKQHFEDLVLKARGMKQELDQWVSLLQKGTFLNEDAHYAIEFAKLKANVKQGFETKSAQVNLSEVMRIADEMSDTHDKLTDLAARKKTYGF